VKIVLISVLSSITATTASVTALLFSYSFILHQQASGEDLMGFAVFSFVPSLLMCCILYTPGLHWLRRRRRYCRPAKLFVFASTVLLNIPAFAVLGYSAAAGGFFGAGEAWYFAIAFAVAGAVYGLMYVRHCRRSAEDE
jgi:hypothetical protein